MSIENEATIIEHMKIVGTCETSIPPLPSKHRFRIFKNIQRYRDYEGRLNKKLLPEEIRVRLPSSGPKRQKLNEEKRREIVMGQVPKSVHEAAMKRKDPLEGITWAQTTQQTAKKTAAKVTLDEDKLRKFDEFLANSKSWESKKKRADQRRRKNDMVSPKRSGKQSTTTLRDSPKAKESSSGTEKRQVDQYQTVTTGESPTRQTLGATKTSSLTVVSPEVVASPEKATSPILTKPEVSFNQAPSHLSPALDKARYRSNPPEDSDESDDDESYVSVGEDSFEAWMNGADFADVDERVAQHFYSSGEEDESERI